MRTADCIDHMFEKLIAALQLTLLMGINLSYNNYDVLLPTTVYGGNFRVKNLSWAKLPCMGQF